jgi:uroporphyrinogen decarboxylase
MRAKFGKGLLAVGGMDKRVLTVEANYAAIDHEIERLRRMVDLGGYIPCPDHRIPPDAKWENVQYYCERMKKAFW